MLPVRHPRSWRVIGSVLVIAAIVVCLLPGRALPQTGVNDKFEHVLLYIGLTVWFAGLYPRTRYAVIAAALLVMGIGIELAQGAMHLGRSAEVRDVIADSIGIVTGLVLAWAGLGGWAQWIDGWTRGRVPARTD